MSTQFESSPAAEPTSPTLEAKLRRIPLSARMVFYTIFFLVALFGGVAGINYQIDRYFPAVHFEIGSWRLVGVVTFVVLLLVYLAIAFHLTTRGAGAFVEFDPPSQLVSNGPYAWVRNPISLCVLLMVLAEAIALSSTGILLMFFIGFGIAQAQAVLLEEPLLERRFGQQYRDYAARVHRWIPRRPSVA